MNTVLNNLLDLMRVRSTAFVGKNLTAPWSILIDEHHEFARFHLVMAGQTCIGLPDGGDEVVLNTGDLAIIPHGLAHQYRNPGNTAPAQRRFLPNFERGAYFDVLHRQPDNTHLLCGYFRISEKTPPVIKSRLPNLMIVRGGTRQTARKFDLIVALIREELLKDGATSPIVLNRLTEILCLYAIHAWMEETMTPDEHLSALANPKTRLVLDSIHNDPTKDWTVDALARLVGQSRTAFAAHFKMATGLTPISYLRHWRIRLASEMLQDTHLAIDEIAFKAGYSDTNAFSRAFKRETGTSPGAFKRMLRY